MAKNYKFDFIKSQIGGCNNNGLKITNKMETDLLMKGSMKLKLQKNLMKNIGKLNLGPNAELMEPS